MRPYNVSVVALGRNPTRPGDRRRRRRSIRTWTPATTALPAGAPHGRGRSIDDGSAPKADRYHVKITSGEFG